MSLHKTTKPKKTNLQPTQEASPMSTTSPVGCRGFIMRWTVRLILIFLALIILIPAGIYFSQPKYYKVLVIGSDQRGSEHARSDVLMVVAIPKSSANTLSMTMIPRDTKIDHPEKGLQKITHFYAMWDDDNEYLGNKELTQETVEDLLGIKVDATIEVTFDSFTEIVDMLGGVDTETYGHLDGTEAQEIVHNRYNKEGGDFGRADAQREILRNLLSRVKDPVKAREVYAYFSTTDRARLDVNTFSFGMFGAAYFIGHRGNVSLGEVEEVVLPGAGDRIYTEDFGKELYYWVLDEEAVKNTVDEYMQ